jgi:ParB family chromosome partitioning protein
MSRKNLLEGLTGAGTFVTFDANSPTQPASAVPFTARGAVGGMTRSISDLAAKASAAKELEAKLTAGEVIIELDPNLVDSSFVADRMVQHDDAYEALREAIARSGQRSPILVRPHPSSPQRYQVAFGHRRLRVATDLGRPVRAVVRKLTDEELALAQGQENSARSDLSFIERARFAQQLENLGYGRDMIMSALAVDKTTVSKMISVTTSIPNAVIEAIGPAPGTGRPRWLDLANMFVADGKKASLDGLLASETFRTAESDVRFDRVLQLLAGNDDALAGDAGKGRGPRRSSRHDEESWPPEGNKVVVLTHNARASLMSIDRRAAPGFGEYLLSQMERLFAEYETHRAGSKARDHQPKPLERT